MDTEAAYYEDPGLWDEGAYRTEEQTTRYATCARLVPQDALSLLDVGAGNGSFLRHLEDLRPDMELKGLERSTVARSKSLCRATLAEGCVEHLPFADRSFDVVSAMEVLEHLPCGQYEQALLEIVRVASRYVLISVPYDERRWQTTCGYCGCRFNPLYHIRSFSEVKLRSLCPGFSVVKVTPLGQTERFLFASLLGRILGRKPGDSAAPYKICPQCGYRDGVVASRGLEPASGQRTGEGGGRGRRLVRALYPKIIRPRWMIALYRRAEPS